MSHTQIKIGLFKEIHLGLSTWPLKCRFKDKYHSIFDESHPAEKGNSPKLRSNLAHTNDSSAYHSSQEYPSSGGLQ